jgi:hypothetical protein
LGNSVVSKADSHANLFLPATLFRPVSLVLYRGLVHDDHLEGEQRSC